MCIGSSPPKLPPPPPPIEVPATPMQSPDEAAGDTSGKRLKAKGRRGLKIDLASSSGDSGLSIPL